METSATMNEHEHFKELCALSASGNISAPEMSELKAHLECCSECRGHLLDFAQVSAQALALHGDTYSHPPLQAGMRERFITRARSEGVPLRQPSKLGDFDFRELFFNRAGAIALLLLLSVGVTTVLWKRLPARQHAASLNQSSAAVASTVGTKVRTIDDGDRDRAVRLQADIRSLEGQRKALEREKQELEQRLSQSGTREEGLSSRLAALEKADAVMRQHTDEQDSRLADLNDELKKKDSTLIDEVATLAERQNQLEGLRAQLGERDAEIKDQQKLLSAETQARDLIIARNLHIIDVHDSDGSGEHQRAFGRIFYTEGKSLVFYAYDLQGPENLDARVSFHVWGGKLGDQQQVRNLGVFRAEDIGAGRWVLSCDDPNVLAKINTVFVTAESARKKIDQPKGKHILYAFLGERPNHP
jgi:hypothetical protein